MRLAKSGDDVRAVRGLEVSKRAPDLPPKSGGRLESDLRGAGMGGGGGIKIDEANGSTSIAGFHCEKDLRHT